MLQSEPNSPARPACPICETGTRTEAGTKANAGTRVEAGDDPGNVRILAARRRFFRCGSCGFFWVDPADRPTEAESRRRYLLHENTEDNRGYMEYLSGIIRRALALFPDVPPEGTSPKAPPRRALDWGSGPNPTASRLLEAAGWEVFSWDPLFSRDVLPPEGAFDLVLSIETAEHFRDPRREFAALGACLKPGGKAVIHTHLAPERDEDFLSWWYIQDITHLSFYSRRSLEVLAGAAGLVLDTVEGGKLAVFRKYKSARSRF